MEFREPIEPKILRFLICSAIFFTLAILPVLVMPRFYPSYSPSMTICWTLILIYGVGTMYFTVFYKEPKETQLELLRLIFIRAPISIMIITLPVFIAFAVIGLCTIINDSWIRFIVFGIGGAILYAWWTGLTNLSNK